MGCFNRRATIQDVNYIQGQGRGPPPGGLINQAPQQIANDVENLGISVRPLSVPLVARTTTVDGVRFLWVL